MSVPAGTLFIVTDPTVVNDGTGDTDMSNADNWSYDDASGREYTADSVPTAGDNIAFYGDFDPAVPNTDSDAFIGSVTANDILNSGELSIITGSVTANSVSADLTFRNGSLVAQSITLDQGTTDLSLYQSTATTNVLSVADQSSVFADGSDVTATQTSDDDAVVSVLDGGAFTTQTLSLSNSAALGVGSGASASIDSATTIGGTPGGASPSDIGVDGSGSVLDISGVVTIGAAAGAMFTVTNGASATTGAVDIGASGDSQSGGASVLGAGANWTIGGDLTVGDQEGGSIAVSIATATVAGNVIVGNLAGVTGLIGVGGGGQAAGSPGGPRTEGGTEGGGTTSDGTGALAVAGDFMLGVNGIGQLRISSNGTLTDQDVVLGQEAGSTGDATIAGAGAVWNSSGNMTVGAAGAGDLTIDSGASLNVGGNVVFTQTAGGAGISTFDGSNVSIGGTLAVSGPGTNTLDIEDSLVTVAGDLDVGVTGTAMLSIGGGGTLAITGDLDVGGANGTGEVGGSTDAVVAGVLALSQNSSAAANAAGQTTTVQQINVADGSYVVSADNTLNVIGGIDVGVLPLSNGLFEVQNSGLVTIGSDFGNIIVGDQGIGRLIIDTGAVLMATNSQVTIGNSVDAGSVGTVSVAGTLAVQEIAIGGRGTGTLLDSGSIEAQFANIGNGNASVTGAVNPGTATVSGTLSLVGLDVGQTGGLSVVDSGTVTTAGISLYAGSKIDVDGTSQLNVSLGGADGALTINAVGSDSGTMFGKVSGAGTIDASVVDNGVITAKGGTLNLGVNLPNSDQTLSGTGAITVDSTGALMIGTSGGASVGSLSDAGTLGGGAGTLGGILAVTTLTVSGSYTNANWGVGNAFNPHAGFTGLAPIYIFGKSAAFAVYNNPTSSVFGAEIRGTIGAVSRSADALVASQGGSSVVQATVTLTADDSGLYHGSFDFVDQGSTQLTIGLQTNHANVRGVISQNATLDAAGGASSSGTYDVTYDPAGALLPGYITLQPNFDNLKAIQVNFALAASPGGSLPGSTTGALPAVDPEIFGLAGNDLTSILAALTPAGTTPNVDSVVGGSAVGAPVAGTLNVLAVTTADAGSTVTLPSGFAAGYLLDGAADLADFNGNSVLIDTATNATLSGAAGDTLFGGNADATLIATTGAESLFGGTAANLFELGASTAVATSQGADTIVGSTGADTVNASGAPLYFGASGTTLFDALGATATLVGGGAETVNAGTADALVFGGSGGLVFNAGSGASTVVGGTGGATLTGGSTGMLYFGTGATTYDPGGAVDTVVGFTGSLTATGGANGTLFFTGTGGNNDVSTGSGSSTIIAFGTSDLLTATGAGDNVIAAAGAGETIDGAQATGQNTFFAFGAGDSVVGGAGATAIESGLGNQTLVAGTGPTLFEILAGTADRAIDIQNFSAAQDYVQLQGYGAGAGVAALQTATIAGGAETLTLVDGTTVTFQGVTGLTGSSFI